MSMNKRSRNWEEAVQTQGERVAAVAAGAVAPPRVLAQEQQLQPPLPQASDKASSLAVLLTQALRR